MYVDENKPEVPLALNDKIAYLEKLRSLYPPQKFEWSASGMIELSDYYLQIDPEKAEWTRR